MFGMHHEPFTLDSLSSKKPSGMVTPPVQTVAAPRSLHFQISKESTPAKSRKAVKSLLAMLDKSPTVRSGGITAEISRDRDKGRP